MNVLLSIKPKYVEEIKKVNKKYEFRKSLCNKKNFHKSNITRCIVKPQELFCLNILLMSLFILFPSFE
ncbi:hypothetical protein LCGC14_1188430 [marine sediment metagenome]|uniref:Uncharacterized protein n=1 Tax=marine sediment metagenome TaxID=412755 RepID=A0A0F9LPZ6_9ZZZZ